MQVGDLVTWHERCKMKPRIGMLLQVENVTAEGPYFSEDGTKIDEDYSYEEALVFWNGSTQPTGGHREYIVVFCGSALEATNGTA